MSPATIEQIITGTAPSEFYTGASALPLCRNAIVKPRQADLLYLRISKAVYKQQPRWLRHETSRVSGGDWQYTETSYMAGTYLSDLVFESFDSTGVTSQQILDLVSELASQPRSYPIALDQSVEEDTEIAHDPEGLVEAVSARQGHWFRSKTGGRVTFSSIEASSDEDLIEAGYPFFSHAEDPELAAQSRRNFLNRIGLGSDEP
jgi:hypothetical protein